jgi:death-on-curing protein
MKYFTAEQLLVMHSEIVDATSGSHGVRDVGLLAAIAEKPRAAFGGADLYPDVFTKAAVYLEAIVNYHVFVDGNKRTGFIAGARFLYINGYDLVATNKAIEHFILAVAIDKTPIQDIAAWLKKHAKKLK